MQNHICPMCGALNSIADVPTLPNCNAFMIIGINTNGSFDLPPNGVCVSMKGCNKCGSLFVGSPAIIGKPIENGYLKV